MSAGRSARRTGAGPSLTPCLRPAASAVLIEEPFSILPLERMCETIEANANQLFGSYCTVHPFNKFVEEDVCGRLPPSRQGSASALEVQATAVAPVPAGGSPLPSPRLSHQRPEEAGAQPPVSPHAQHEAAPLLPPAAVLSEVVHEPHLGSLTAAIRRREHGPYRPMDTGFFERMRSSGRSLEKHASIRRASQEMAVQRSTDNLGGSANEIY